MIENKPADLMALTGKGRALIKFHDGGTSFVDELEMGIEK
jgi:hypothetical protein